MRFPSLLLLALAAFGQDIPTPKTVSETVGRNVEMTDPALDRRVEAAQADRLFRRDINEYKEAWNDLMREWNERGTWNRKKAARVDKLWKAVRRNQGWIQ